MAWSGLNVMKNANNIIIWLPQLMHKLAQNIYWKHNVKMSDGEVYQTPNKTLKIAWIREGITISIIKLELLFQEKLSRTEYQDDHY